MYKKLLISFLLMMLLSLSFFKAIDDFGSQQLDKAFVRAVSVFAIARSLNGLISVLQGTQVYATPAGVGVNFAVGQILDPMNDMVERFSWIMLMSSVSLGIQEVMLSLCKTFVVESLLVIATCVLLGMMWLPKLHHAKSFELVFKSMVLISFLRFVIPLMVLTNEMVYTHVLQDKYEESKTSLSLVEMQTEKMVHKIRHKQEAQKSSWFNINAKINQLNVNMKSLWKALEVKFNNIIEDMLSLISIFIMQSIVLPLMFVYISRLLFKKVMKFDVSTLNLF